MNRKNHTARHHSRLWGRRLYAADDLAHLGNAPLLKYVPHLADSGASWYWWQLSERTTMGIISSWVFYGLHQLTMWGLIFYAQRSQPKYGHTLHEINWWALGLNGFFCLLHIVQTHI